MCFKEWLDTEENKPIDQILVEYGIQTLEQLADNEDLLLEFMGDMLRRVGSAGASFATDFASEPLEKLTSLWLPDKDQPEDIDPKETYERLSDLLEEHGASPQVMKTFRERASRAVESENPIANFKREYNEAIKTVGNLEKNDERANELLRGFKKKSVYDRVMQLAKGIVRMIARFVSLPIRMMVGDEEVSKLPGGKMLGLEKDQKDSALSMWAAKKGGAIMASAGRGGFKGKGAAAPLIIIGTMTLAALIVYTQWTIVGGGSLMGLLGFLFALYGLSSSAWEMMKGIIPGIKKGAKSAWGELKKDPSELRYFRKNPYQIPKTEPQRKPSYEPYRGLEPRYA